MKRVLAGLFFAALLLYNGSAQAEGAKAAVLIEAQSGRVLYESNAHAPLPMASTTKIMTALLALENGSLSDVVTVSRNAFGVPGTSIYLSEGETLTLEQAKALQILDDTGYCPHEQSNCHYGRSVTETKTTHTGATGPHSAYVQNNSFLADHIAYQYSS